MSEHTRGRTPWVKTSRRRCGPRRKLRYATEVDADRAAAGRAEQGETRPLRSYSCSWCGGWHLTHQPLRTG